MSEWKPIESAPKDQKPILVGFQGQYDWFYFVAQRAYGVATTEPGYAAPTHWHPLPKPPK